MKNITVKLDIFPSRGEHNKSFLKPLPGHSIRSDYFTILDASCLILMILMISMMMIMDGMMDDHDDDDHDDDDDDDDDEC